MSEVVQSRDEEVQVAQGNRHQHPPTGPAAGLHEQEPTGRKGDRLGDTVPAALAGHRILLSFAVNPFDHWPLFEAAHREWNQTSDALISGRRVPGMLNLFRAGLQSGALWMLLLSRPSIGFDTVSVKDGWLSGHLLWLRPEWRGRGVCRAYFEAAHDLSLRLGLRGFQFISTLDRWKKGNFFHRELYTVQENGVEVFRYWKEA